MGSFRRILGWAGFLGFLGAIGVVVYLEVRSRPRCTIAGGYRFLQTSPDGATVVTATATVLGNEIPGNKAVRVGAPVLVWDTRTGQVRSTFLENAGYVELSDAALSPDGALAPDAGTPAAGTWCHPAFAQRCMFARNDEELICVAGEVGAARGSTWHDARHNVPAVAAVDAEVAVRGEQDGIGDNLRQPHQAGVGEAHGHVGIFPQQRQNRPQVVA